METPVQESPQPHPHTYSIPTSQSPYTPEAMQYSSMGPTSMSMRPNSPEMPTILETNSQPSPDSRLHYPAGEHQASQSTWNPTHSWIPTTGPSITQPPPQESLTGRAGFNKCPSTLCNSLLFPAAPTVRMHFQSVSSAGHVHTYNISDFHWI